MAADLVDARLRPASPRLDCDLSLSQRYIWTMQGEQGCRKQWHVRSLIDGLHVAPTLDRTRALTWTLIPVSGRLGLLCITCALPLGIVKSCVVGSSSIAVTEWIYLPAETGHADGLLFAICDQELDVSQDREQLVLESSLLVQRAEARSGSMQMRDFPRHARCAILSLVANRALMPQSGSLWSDLLHLSGVAAGPDVPIVDVVLSSIDDEAEVRGILSVASWPITVFTGEAASRLLMPTRLRLSNADEHGDVLFALIVKAPRGDDIATMPLFLLATDGVYRLRKSEATP